MHLVTGRAGQAHINSDMVGRFNAGTIGDGAYILNTQNKMICTVVDANHVTIATGDAIVQGRHVTNEAAETLTIQSGGQGVSRHDLVCVRYTNSGGIESAELVVVAGTPSAAPVDPSYNDGSILDGDTPVDIPLYRLVIDGINLESVDTLVDTIESVVDVKNNIGTLLWSGSWNVGETKTIAGLSNFSLFVLWTEGSATPLLAYSSPVSDVLRSLGGYVNTTPNIWLYSASFRRNGETLTLEECRDVNVIGTTYNRRIVSEIRGII